MSSDLIRRSVPLGSALLVLLGLTAPNAQARPQFAQKEGVGCLHCPVQPGRARNFRGLYYAMHELSFTDVASFCGNTPQYASLQKLYDRYRDQGFAVLGFPANEFGQQEPGTDAEIKQLCTAKYQVTFPIFSRFVVKGDGQAPLYRFLTDRTTDPRFGGAIEWNFAKFLINREGQIVARFPAGTDPLTPSVVGVVEKELAAPKAEN